MQTQVTTAALAAREAKASMHARCLTLICLCSWSTKLSIDWIICDSCSMHVSTATTGRPAGTCLLCLLAHLSRSVRSTPTVANHCFRSVASQSDPKELRCPARCSRSWGAEERRAAGRLGCHAQGRLPPLF